MLLINRRQWMTVSAFGAFHYATARDPRFHLPLGFSLYGMKSLPLTDAIRACAQIGYEGVELALMPGYPSEPKLLSADGRKELRKRMTDANLSLHGLMENLSALSDDKAQTANLDRLKTAAELGHVLSPNVPAPIETILGGKPAEWDTVKDQLADRLAKWAEVAKATKTVVAIKPHVGNALHSIAGVTWLLKQVNSPWLKLAFDYSHFHLRGEKLADAVAALLPHSVFAHVKDAKGTPDKFEFLLPGEHGTDYTEYVKLLSAAKFTAPVVVEVSGMLSNKPGYDPITAAKTCYTNLSKAFGLGAR